MSEKQEDKVYSTRDLYLAATLVSLKFYMCGIDYQIEGGSGKVVGYFNFETSPELLETENKYWQKLVEVEPRDFITNMRGLKAQVTNAYKNPRRDSSRDEKEIKKEEKVDKMEE
jgi:hypothetical protein